MPILSCVSEPDRTKHLAARPLATPGWWHCANCGQCWQEAVSTLCDHCGLELKFSPCCGRVIGLTAEIGRLTAALVEIAVGEGRYSRDPLEHAANTIEDMQKIALEALGQPPEVVHQCPPAGSGVMPCCGKTPFSAPSDRMTLDPALVTCGKRP